MQIWNTTAVVAAIVATALVPGGAAWAQGSPVKVTGSYDTLFTKFDVLSVVNGILYFDGTVRGPFELTTGQGGLRTGTIVFSEVGNLTTEAPNEGSISGGAVWLFDDGVVCSGELGGALVPPAALLEGDGEFSCTDGTRLRLDVRGTEVVPATSVKAEFTGELLPGGQ